ncbi:MAG: hypothetical protein MUC92_05725 [Fimbriimonadaceae bacterium]|jgi:hypothetical protein|nr:hypothetical protein [Fimbriimonadaceae bacterium]
MKSLFRLSWLLALFFLASCARFPQGGVAGQTTRLVFSMNVAGQLRTGLSPGQGGLPYAYLVALRLNTDENPTTQGPIPIVIPSGNGIVAGNATHYILWNPLVAGQYQIWQFRDGTLNESFQTGIPVNFRLVNEGDRSLQFEIDLSQLVPTNQVSTIRSVQVNFLTMNNTNTSGGGRIWDALGDGVNPSTINSPFLVRLRNSQTFTNSNQGQIEPSLDCPDPDLDITDWSIEVRLP